MTLRLSIDNMARRPDGGPLSVEVNRRDLDIGRDAHLDWTLPDPERTVSGKHCEIKFRDGAYWLFDVSRNGTYLNGSQHRLEAPRRLRKGDRLMIGPYFVSVEIDEASADIFAPMTSGPSANLDPFVELGGAAPPADRRRFRPKAAGPPPTDALDFVMSLPEPRGPEPTPRVPPPPGRSGRALGPSLGSDALFSAQEELAPSAGAARGRDARSAPPNRDEERLYTDLAELSPKAAPPLPDSGANFAGLEDEAGAGVPPHAARAAANADLDMPRPRRTPAALPRSPDPPPSGAADAELLGQIAAAAGLAPDVFAGRDPAEVASDIGGMLRAANFHLYQMLNARAETRAHIRAGGRTMIQAIENNPLKFNPTPDQALAAMLGPRTRAYLGPVAAIEQGFGDLQKHLSASYSAMQQAVEELFEDLAPQKIDASVDSEKGLAALVSSRKAKLWDIFSERWRAKSKRSDGRLGEAFLKLFGEAYDRSSGKF